MSLLDDIDVGTAKAADEDVIRNSYAVLDSDIYPFFIEEAYLTVSQQNAVGVQLTLKEKKDGTGRVYEDTLWFKSKTGKSYWEDNNGGHHPLPSFVAATTLCQIICGTDRTLASMKTDKMFVQRWNSTEKKRMPEEVEMLKELLGKAIYVAIMRTTVDKTRDNGSGKYIPTGETEDRNEIAKFFRAKDKKTITEIEANTDEPAAFFDKWIESYKGKVRNKAKGGGKGKSNGAGANAGAVASAGIAAMFDKDS